jgi:glyoxylase-like metal-dependent hydrolase (beta-lactamase superfamily II)
VHPRLAAVLASSLFLACPAMEPLPDAGDLADAASPDPDPDSGAVGADAGTPDSDAGADPTGDAGGAAEADAGVDAGAADAGPLARPFDVSWIHGAPDCGTSTDPPLQAWSYDDDTVILRQSKCVNFEGPFLYLLFGEDKALLLDTGATSSATSFPVRQTVEDLITAHLDGAPRSSLELVVTHSHAHGDHVQGDGQFSGQPNTTLVSAQRSAVEAHFGITSWPTDIVSYDLGGRVVDVIPIPGHESNHIALYDRRTGLLLTGDTFYPGFIFISQWNTFRQSIGRLADFVADRPVAWVLGTHVEMRSTPGQAYNYGTTYQPDEHVLQLTRDNLLELDTQLQVLGSTPTAWTFDDFILSP